jgi:hypothetical protein
MNTPSIVAQRIIYCDGGLGNRLNSLVPPLALAVDTSLATSILWPRTRWCDAGFEDLFSGGVKVIGLHLDPVLEQLSNNNFVDLTHRPADEVAAKLFPMPHDSISDLEGYRRLWDDPTKHILYRHCLIPEPLEDLSFLIKGMNQFFPLPEIVEVVAEFCERFQIDTSVTGLHYRGTDYGLREKEVEFFKRLITAQRNKQFYVCSDEPSVVATLSEADNVIKTNDVSFKNFRAHLDSVINSGQIFRSKDSVYLALIEMLILSRTDILETSNSTFLRFAQLLSRARARGLNGW